MSNEKQIIEIYMYMKSGQVLTHILENFSQKQIDKIIDSYDIVNKKFIDLDFNVDISNKNPVFKRRIPVDNIACIDFRKYFKPEVKEEVKPETKKPWWKLFL